MMRPTPVPLALFRPRYRSSSSSLFQTRQSPLAPKAAGSQTCRHRSFLPRILRPELWKGLVPRAPGRDGDDRKKEDRTGGALRSTRGKEKTPWRRTKWNPATYFIFMFMLIGSMSIHMISLRRELGDFMRRANVRIDILREAVEAVERGEKIDIAEALGTGDPASEKEWEEVLKQIENESAWKDTGKIRQPGAPPKQQKSTTTTTTPESSTTSQEAQQQQQQKAAAAPTASGPPPKPTVPVFY